MDTLNKIFGFFVAASLLISGCAAQAVHDQPEEQEIPTGVMYEGVLGKSVTDQVVADFIASNNCFSADKFRLCTALGIALRLDSSRTVETVYLYLKNSDGFAPYKGELPYGLKFYDTLGAVEYKLKRQGVGTAGLPDASGIPDHLYYRAIYKQAGMTIIYNSPFADEDATIKAVLISK